MDTWFKNTNRLQIDLTSYCNAHCGSCQRHKGPEDDTLHADLTLNHMKTEVWKKIIKDANDLGSIDTILLNGNWGDAFMHPEILDLIKYHSTMPNLKNLIASTNGSIRTEKFWHDVGKLNVDGGIYIIFCIDGLSDTHKIYRRKTSFEKIIKNMKAYIDAGGLAGMITTAFDHNFHQLQDIKQLAKDLGCWTWECRTSHSGEEYMSHNVKVTQNKITKEIAESEAFFNIEDNLRFRPRKDFDNQTICPWFNDREVQIDPWGQMWSCCYASETRFGIDRDYTMHPEHKKYYHKDLDLTKHSLGHALSSDFWKRIKTFDHFMCWDNCGIENKKWENYELLWRDDHPEKVKEKQNG